MKDSDELQVPVAYCETCKDEGPVVIRTFEDIGITAVYCPGCDSVINIDNLEVKWYSFEDLEKIGWKPVD